MARVAAAGRTTLVRAPKGRDVGGACGQVGEPRLALRDGGLGGELRLKVPDLAPLRPALGQAIAGSAALRAVQNAIAAAKQCGRDGHADSLTVAEGFVERVLRNTQNPDL